MRIAAGTACDYLDEKAACRLWLQMVQSRSCVINLALASSRSWSAFILTSAAKRAGIAESSLCGDTHITLSKCLRAAS
jgi:hypothetical protein